jgi:SAM-dependent methyltransferase|tara:strand:- start:274 stop:1542 length:1269 start_codon:yes stop_codon:yes gene_type:complete
MPSLQEDAQVSELQPPVVHLDIPERVPRSTVFEVVGWVTSDVEILNVGSGVASFVLMQREDVEVAYPEANFVRGFAGRVSCPDIDRNPIKISVETIVDTTEHTFYLEPNPMLSLSKKEKFARFQSAFPGVDPGHCIEASVSLEIDSKPMDISPKISHLGKVLSCPSCHSQLHLQNNSEGFECDECAHVYVVDGRCVDLLSDDNKKRYRIKENEVIASRAQDPLALALIGYYRDGLILDCGSGFPMQDYSNVINLEIEKYKNTDVISVGEVLPFLSDSFDAVFSFSVLEHVKDPFKSADELVRVLKPGGTVYFSVPFLQPVHAYPHHYFNMTSQGLRSLVEGEIEIISSGIPVSGHPLFAVSWILNTWVNGLPPDSREEFEKKSISDFLHLPELLINDSYVREINSTALNDTACTTMILGRKV